MFNCSVLLRRWLWGWFVLLLLTFQLVLLVLTKVQSLDHHYDDDEGDDDDKVEDKNLS